MLEQLGAGSHSRQFLSLEFKVKKILLMVKFHGFSLLEIIELLLRATFPQGFIKQKFQDAV